MVSEREIVFLALASRCFYDEIFFFFCTQVEAICSSVLRKVNILAKNRFPRSKQASNAILFTAKGPW